MVCIYDILSPLYDKLNVYFFLQFKNDRSHTVALGLSYFMSCLQSGEMHSKFKENYLHIIFSL